MDKPVVRQSMDHEERKIRSLGQVRCQHRIAHVFSPERQAIAVALLKVVLRIHVVLFFKRRRGGRGRRLHLRFCLGVRLDVTAVIIAAIIVIAALVGITVYLIGSERFEREAEQELRTMEKELEQIKNGGPIIATTPNAALDYQTYHDDSASVMQKFRDRTFRDGKDPEGPDRAKVEEIEEYYDDDEDW